MKILGKRRRAIKVETDVATLKRYQCGSVALIESKSKFGLSTQWIVARRVGEGEVIESRHRKPRPAVKVLEDMVKNFE